MTTTILKPGNLVRVSIAAPHHQGVVGLVEFYSGDSNVLVINTTIYNNNDVAFVHENKPKTFIAIDPKHAILLRQ